MRCRIVKMHYRSWGTCTAPLCGTWERGSSSFQESIRCWTFAWVGVNQWRLCRGCWETPWAWCSGQLLYALLLPEPRWPTDTIFSDDYHVSETMTCHWPRYHGSRPFAIVQARGVIVLWIRLAFGAVHWLMCQESDERNNLGLIFSTKLIYIVETEMFMESATVRTDENGDFRRINMILTSKSSKGGHPPTCFTWRSVLPSLIW
jgi:hypothetical protein